MLTERVRISPDAMLQEIGGEGVILDLVSATYFGLDQVGVRVWQLLQVNPGLHDAFDVLLAEYEVDPATLEQDLRALVGQLVAAGLATIESSE
jgi:hypothetical protein